MRGPVSLSRLARPVPIAAGMILSNEPGFYLPDHYGIRLENLLLVQPADLPGAAKPFLRFETLTLAPFDTRLIDPGMLEAVGDGVAERVSRPRAGGGRAGTGRARPGVAGGRLCADWPGHCLTSRVTIGRMVTVACQD